MRSKLYSTLIRIRILFFLPLFFIVLNAALFGSARAQGNANRQATAYADNFQPATCMFNLPFNMQTSQDIQCGYLTVPLYHERPEAGTIQLAVAILKSSASSPAADPLFMAQGGPGGSTIDTYAAAMLSNPLRGKRDIVLFDQRGTYYSKPFLDCPEFYELMIKTLDQDLNALDSIRLENNAAQACRVRLTKEGIDLSAFNSVENAADIEALRLALGYPQINLYGASYGTKLVLTAVQANPQHIRSVILDAVVPPQENFIITASRTQNRAFEELFTACQQSPSCNASYPDLRNYFYELVDRLNKSPVTFGLKDPNTGKTYPTLMDGDSLVGTLFQMIYSTELIPFLPKMIFDAGNGSYGLIQQILPILVFDRTMSYGMYYSVNCSESVHYDPQQIDLSGIPLQLSKDTVVEAEGFQQLCRNWQVNDLSDQLDDPVVSDIPTLIFNGRFDPITPPANGQLVAKTLKNSYVHTFQNTGHGALLASDCALSMAVNFLDDPSQGPNSACVSTAPAIPFILRKEVLELPVVYRILSLKGSIITELTLYGLSVFTLATSLLIFPLAWIIKSTRRKPSALRPVMTDNTGFPASLDEGQPSLPASPSSALTRQPVKPSLVTRLAAWLATLNAFLAIVFSVALLVVLVIVIQDARNLYVYGIPASTAPVFVLPLVILMLSLLMVYITVHLWRKKEGSRLRQLYYTLLTCAALVCTGFLAYWGMLTILL